jgi:hypothetical protein
MESKSMQQKDESLPKKERGGGGGGGGWTRLRSAIHKALKMRAISSDDGDEKTVACEPAQKFWWNVEVQKAVYIIDRPDDSYKKPLLPEVLRITIGLQRGKISLYSKKFAGFPFREHYDAMLRHGSEVHLHFCPQKDPERLDEYLSLKVRNAKQSRAFVAAWKEMRL